jgi:4-diphosphocytidyl-2-C-methyl-D-erythritol kinase
MLVFPNAKINIGLYVIGKRNDGFHDISSVFYPIRLSDALEFVPGKGKDVYHYSGFPIPGDPADNLCARALALVRESHEIPPLDVYLHKAIPMGAGLGGGSSDAAFLLKALNDHFKLGYSSAEMKILSAKLGSDCAFFIENGPAFAEGRGELLSPVQLDLSGYHIVVVGPGVHISTQEAYKHVNVGPISFHSVDSLTSRPISEWKGNVYNAFEKYAFEKYPQIKSIRDGLYEMGAAYASMTGSGSAVYGIFAEAPKQELLQKFEPHFVYSGAL